MEFSQEKNNGTMNADYKNVWWLKTILNFNLIETCIYTFSKAKEMKHTHAYIPIIWRG